MIMFSSGSLVGKRYREVRRPEGQVVPQELHDQGAVFVGLLSKGVQLRNSFIKSLQTRVGSVTKLSCGKNKFNPRHYTMMSCDL
jgi:hypothetical protein